MVVFRGPSVPLDSPDSPPDDDTPAIPAAAVAFALLLLVLLLVVVVLVVVVAAILFAFIKAWVAVARDFKATRLRTSELAWLVRVC